MDTLPMEATEMNQAIRSAGSSGDVICLDSPEGKKDGAPLFSNVSLSFKVFQRIAEQDLQVSQFFLVFHYPSQPPTRRLQQHRPTMGRLLSKLGWIWPDLPPFPAAVRSSTRSRHPASMGTKHANMPRSSCAGNPLTRPRVH